MDQKAVLCLCMIVKDEEKNLERCFESVKGLVDEIVLVDTGSSDNTVELAQRLGAKVYHYPWDESFANARNFAMTRTKSEWLLLLDADEALDWDSRPKVAEFIATTSLDGAYFRVRNYMGHYSPKRYTLHNALRLLRNNGKYRYVGSIHEQITCDEADKISEHFTALDAVVHHYGYLYEAVREKQKRKRNLPILERQLQENPTEPFTLFNIGNEYVALGDYKTALEYYLKSKNHLKDRRIAFGPHLFFRTINTYGLLNQHQNALEAIREGLENYPRCTDFEYIRASLLIGRKRYTLAIQSLEKCLQMGVPPSSLEFLPGCGTYRAAFLLGELYGQLEDDERALYYYDMTLQLNPQMLEALYRAGAALNRMHKDKNKAAEKVFSHFSSREHVPNVIVGADVLINERLYEQALRALEALPEAREEAEIPYLKGRALFFLGRCDEARPYLEAACAALPAQTKVLPNIRPAGALLLFVDGLIQGGTAAERALEFVNAHCGVRQRAVCRLMKNILLDATGPEDPRYENEGAAELEVMMVVLDVVLKAGRFELFEKMLRALNFVDTKNVLIRLAELYDKNDFKELAVEYVLRSVKELDYLDAAGAQILFMEIG